MIRRAGRFFRLGNLYDNPLAQQRANGLFALTWALVALWAVWLALVAAPALIAGAEPGPLVLPVLIGPLLLVGALAALQTRRLPLASWLFVGLLLALCLPPLLDMAVTPATALVTPAQLLIPLVAAGLLLERRGLSLVAVVLLAMAGMRAYMQTNALGAMSSDMPAIFIVLAAVTVLLLAFGGQLNQTLARLGRERTLLRGSAGFVHTMVNSRDENALLTRTVDLLRDTMGYGQAQIFVIYDDAIQRIVRRGLETQAVGTLYNVPQADRAVVATLARTLEPVVSDSDNGHSRLVAPAQAAITVPVLAGGRLLAAIDVHSERPGFSADEVQALTDLAAQLGAHLAELRLVADLRQTVREQEAALIAGPQRAGTTRRLIGAGQSASEPVTGFDFESEVAGINLLRTTQWSPALQVAFQNDAPSVTVEGDVQRLSVPVRYRGVTLGAMTFDVPTDRPLGERELNLARIIAERLGQAVDNARLLGQSEALAQREHTASDVANTLISATDVRAVLALAAETFNEAMGAVSTRVTLIPDQAEATPTEDPEGVAP